MTNPFNRDDLGGSRFAGDEFDRDGFDIDEFDSDEERRVDVILRAAASDTRSVIDRQPIPPFQTRTNVGRQVLAAAAALLLVVGAVGLVLTQQRANNEPGAVATTDSNTDDGGPDPTSPDPTEPDPTGPDPTSPAPDPTIEEATARHGGLTGTQPANPLANLNTTLAPATETAVAEPEAYTTFVDPAFGTEVIRVTNALSGEYITPQIPQAFNADETLALLYQTTDNEGSGHWLFDGNTFQLLRRLDVAPSDIEHLYWSGVDPDLLYLIEDKSLIELNVATDTRTALATFDECDTLTSGAVPVPPSTDGNTFGLLCESASGNTAVAVTREGGTVSTSTIPTTSTDAPWPSPSGQFFVNIDDSGEATVLNRSLEPTGVTFTAELATFAFVVDDSGRELAVSTRFDSDTNGTAVVNDLVTGETTAAVGEETGYPYPPQGHRLHSGSGSPFVAVGINGDPAVFEGVLDGEVVLIDLSDPANATTLRLAHHRTDRGASPWAAPTVSVSPSGTKVLFASSWGTDHVNTYLVAIER